MMKGKHIRAESQDFRHSIGLYIYEIDADGKKTVGSLEMKPVEDPALQHDSMTNISPSAAQVLMDDLWHAGIRPTEGTGSAGSLKATENHLQDMRAIVFKKLGMAK